MIARESPSAVWLNGRLRWVLALMAGLLMAAAFPPVGWWWAAIVSVAVSTVATFGASLRFSAALGLLAGASFFAPLLSWMTVVGVDAWIALTLLCANWWALLFLAQALVQRLRAWPVLVPAVWVASEALRGSQPLGGFPWGRIAFAQVDGPLVSVAGIVGTAGLAYVVAAVGATSGYGLIVAREGSFARRRLAAPAAALVVVVLSAFAAPGIAAAAAPAGTLQVAIVQGGTPGVGLSAMGERRAVLASHVAQTRRLAGDGASPDVVLWPENSTDIDPFVDAQAYADIDAAVRDVGAPVLVGAVVAAGDGSDRVANTGVLWSPVSGPGARYVKQHPVPFGEYVPFRDVLGRFIGRLALVPRDFVAGTSPGVVRVGNVDLGVIICFEVAYDSIVRDTVAAGGQVLVVQTNNATYGGTSQLAQQVNMSRLRAVEFGIPVLVAATSGISAVVDRDGSLRSTLDDGASGVLRAEVAVPGDETIASRIGSLVEFALVAVAVTAVIAGVVVAMRRRERWG